MTEEEWLTSTDLGGLLDYLRTGLHIQRTKAGRRKLQLFGCAWCRPLLPVLEDDHPGRLFLQGAERHADGFLKREGWKRAERAYYEWFSTMGDRRSETIAIHSLGTAYAFAGVTDVVAFARRVLLEQGETAQQIEQRQSNMLRHIFGNPFSPCSLGHLPATVVRLARSLYEGEECAFALQDALEEAGQADLSAHFRAEKWHPKGCWVVDLILKKK